ncbi:MAG: hypothetical protein AAFO75_11435, partial [Pseudomonadota bacterium]
MTTSGSNGEASMDEILASIRQIIQEEPVAQEATPAGNSKIESGTPQPGDVSRHDQAAAAASGNGLEGPLKQRLADALNQLPTA